MISIVNSLNTQSIQRSLSDQIKQVSESSERLSSGKRVNSASDDPGVIGAISKLNAKISSISQGLLNGFQAITLTQSAESGLSEINNLLSMIRALAVEGTDTTLTDADRTTLQVEVDAYLSEIDTITTNTAYNDIILLDGSTTSASFNIGEDAASSLSISLVDSDSVALNLSATSGVSEFTSGRVTGFNYNSSNLATNDILINGENAIAATLSTDLTSGNNTASALATAINANSNTHGATASGFNNLTSAVVSSLSMSDTFTINSNTISVQTSLANLVTEINQEASGVTALLNSDNSITLSNTTGNDIIIAGNAPSAAGFTSGTYLGYLKLTNNDGTYVKIEANTLANGYASNQGNIDDLARFGFNEVDSNTQISSDLVSTNALTASHDIKINDTAVGTSTSSSAAAKAVSINAISSTTNVTASGYNLVTVTVNNAQSSSAASNISLNGNAINFSSANTLSLTISAINTAAIGDIVASANSDGNLQLVSSSGADITIASSSAGTYFTAHTDATGATISTASSVTFKGQIQLTHSSTDTVKISGDDVVEIGMQAQASTSTPSAGSTISVSSATNATSALTKIDTAIDTIANTRGKFGSAENRIEYRMNVLTNVQIASTLRLSKIEDADFALETAKFTKSQIISKAATSMLAQANASGDVLLRLVT